MNDFDRYAQGSYNENPELKRRRNLRRKKAEQRKRQLRIYRGLAILACIVMLLVGVIGIFKSLVAKKKDKNTDSISAAEDVVEKNNDYEVEIEEGDKNSQEKLDEYISDQVMQTEEGPIDEAVDRAGEIYVSNKTAADFAFYESESVTYMGNPEMTSEYGILVSPDTQSVVAEKNSKTRISPASMTKVLTCLVACEHIQNLDDTVVVTIEDTDYSYSNDCSAAGFAVDEVVTVADLLYGTILPSGGDAAHALARYVAGDHEHFVEMMNQKLSELGLSETSHFTNCVGIYNDNHYSTAYDIAVIMNAAMDNPLARQILSAHRYTTSFTDEHPEGIDLSNLFLRRIEDKDTKGEVIGAKTGYVVQSRNCAVSYYTNDDGSNYICVTATAHSAWRAVYDHVAVYNIYAAGNTGYHKDGSNSQEED